MEGDCNVYAHSSLWMRPTGEWSINAKMVYRIMCHEGETLLKLNFFQLIERYRSWSSVVISIYRLDAHDLKKRKCACDKAIKNACVWVWIQFNTSCTKALHSGISYLHNGLIYIWGNIPEWAYYIPALVGRQHVFIQMLCIQLLTTQWVNLHMMRLHSLKELITFLSQLDNNRSHTKERHSKISCYTMD